MFDFAYFKEIRFILCREKKNVEHTFVFKHLKSGDIFHHMYWVNVTKRLEWSMNDRWNQWTDYCDDLNQCIGMWMNGKEIDLIATQIKIKSLVGWWQTAWTGKNIHKEYKLQVAVCSRLYFIIFWYRLKYIFVLKLTNIWQIFLHNQCHSFTVSVCAISSISHMLLENRRKQITN